MSINQQVKMVGPNGQLSLGKAFAGKMVLIEQVEEGTWLIKTGEFIPDSEKWIHEPHNRAKLERALAWVANNKTCDNFDQFVEEFERGQK
jgi:hypothetical protein